MKTACFTGHRPKSLPWGYDESHKNCLKFKKTLKKIIVGLIKNGVSYFISGMAMGVDMIAAEIVLELKRKYNHITLEVAIPCKTQTNGWTFGYLERYRNIIANCDKITILSEVYTLDCMQKRNQYMVDCSNYVIAVFRQGSKGGTKNTIDYATSKDKQIIFIKL